MDADEGDVYEDKEDTVELEKNQPISQLDTAAQPPLKTAWKQILPTSKAEAVKSTGYMTAEIKNQMDRLNDVLKVMNGGQKMSVMDELVEEEETVQRSLRSLSECMHLQEQRSAEGAGWRAVKELK